MNQNQFIEIAKQVMSDETPIEFSIQIKEAWILVSALQLSHRHPGLGLPLKDAIQHIARQIQAAIEDRHEGAHDALEFGWNEEYDA